MKFFHLFFICVCVLSNIKVLAFEVGLGLPSNSQGYQLKSGTTMTDISKFAEGVSLGSLSFLPDKSCITPPKSPPDRLLKKKYKPEIVLNLASQSAQGIDKFIHHLDLNGDGICDWLREGEDQHRMDQGWADPSEFLFLGTSNGWRESAQTTIGKKLDKQSKTNPANPYFGAAGFRGFYVLLAGFVYVKNDPRPFLIASAVGQDRQQIDISSYRTFRWNDKIDNFDDVPLNQHASMLLFLQKKFCSNDPLKVILGRDVRRFSNPSYNDDTLCKIADPSIKK